MSLINQMLQDIEHRRYHHEPFGVLDTNSVYAVVKRGSLQVLPYLLLAILSILALCFTLYISGFTSIAPPAYAHDQSALISVSRPVSAPVRLSLGQPFHLSRQLGLDASMDSILDMNPPGYGVSREGAAQPKKGVQSDKSEAVKQTTETAKVALADPQHQDKPTQTKVEEVSQVTTTVEAKPSIHKHLSAEQQANVYYQSALAYVQQGRVAESVEALKQCLAINPAFDDARQTLVSLLVENSRNDEAMEVLKIGLKSSADNRTFALILSRLQMDAGMLAEAKTTLDSHSAVGDDMNIEAQKAVIAQKMHLHQEAVQHFESALKGASANPAWWVGLAVSQQALGLHDEAKANLVKAQQSKLIPELAAFVDSKLKEFDRLN